MRLDTKPRVYDGSTGKSVDDWKLFGVEGEGVNSPELCLDELPCEFKDDRLERPEEEDPMCACGGILM